MSEIELVVPFCLPPSELATDLLRDLQLPALATLLSRGKKLRLQSEADKKNSTEETDVYARALPHEQWLSRRFGVHSAPASGTSPPIAAVLMKSWKMETSLLEIGHWFIVQPVHLHIARDHLVLTDTRQLVLSEADSRALFDSAARCFTEAGMTLHYGQADCWFVRADCHNDLRTATPDAACGHNIDIWMPQGESARAWRKLQNEIQMNWHTHPVNDAREAKRLVPINSVWLWGGGAWPTTLDKVALPTICNFTGWLQAFAALAPSTLENADAAKVIADTSPQRLVWLDLLAGSALAGDWAEWRTRLETLEALWFAPLLAALADGRVEQLSLILSKSDTLRQWRASRASLRKFWIKPTLARIAS